jgi:hypothetical protein
MSALRRRGERALPAFHMVEFLDASIRGLTADQILSGEKSLNLRVRHDCLSS